MKTEYLVILELVVVLIIFVTVGALLWREKRLEIHDLSQLNEALVAQIDALQNHIDDHQAASDDASNDFHDVDLQLDEHLCHVFDDTEASWDEMEILINEKHQLMSELKALCEQQEPLDSVEINKQLASLTALLEKSERKVRVQKNELKSSKKNIQELKEKLRKLSKKVLRMGKGDIRESRLARDKQRLTERFEKIKEKYDDQQILTRNLKSELKTSFRAEEVVAMREELALSEDALSRALTEKQFIEDHFLKMDKDQTDQDEMITELQRAKREIQLLEKTVIDMDIEAKNNLDR